MEVTNFWKTIDQTTIVWRYARLGQSLAQARRLETSCRQLFPGKIMLSSNYTKFVSKPKNACNKIPAAFLPYKTIQRPFELFQGKIDVGAMFRRLWAGPQKHQHSFEEALTVFDLLTVKSENYFLLMKRR